MNVVATAPSPGVMMPSLPVAGRGVEGASAAEPCTNLFSFEQWARGAGARPEPRTRLGLGARFRLFRSSGRRIHECHSLDHGDPGRYGQNDGDDGEHPPVEHEAEEGLRGRQENYSLRALKQPDLRVEAEGLGTRARVRREERADEPEQGDDEQRNAAVEPA